MLVCEGRDLYSKNINMKRKLNIYCALTIIVLLFSLSEHLYGFFVGVKSGVEAAQEEFETCSKNGKSTAYNAGKAMGKGTREGLLLQNIRSVDLMPTTFLHNEKWIKEDLKGDSVAIWPMQAIVSISPKAETKSNVLLQFCLSVFPLIISVFAIVAIVYFFKLIRRINRHEVFSWHNVRLLHKLGYFLIAFALLDTAYSLINAIIMADKFVLNGYSINYFSCCSFITLLLGLVSLIIAETFSVGLKLQEEQDLTI